MLVSLTAASTGAGSPVDGSGRVCTVNSRSAKLERSAHQSGLTISSPSMAAHDVAGQQSLSCQTMAPAVRGHHER